MKLLGLIFIYVDAPVLSFVLLAQIIAEEKVALFSPLSDGATCT